jgi:hypothetical protein
VLIRLGFAQVAQADSPAAAAIQYRTYPSAVLVRPWAVDHFDWLCGLLTDGYIDEDGPSERILECLQRRQGMAWDWQSREVEVTGRMYGYLVGIRIAGDEWWISPDQIMRVAAK